MDSERTAIQAAHLVEIYVRADIASGNASARSLGTLYGMAIGIVPVDAPALWRSINQPIKGWAGSPQRFDQVKKIGWRVYKAARSERPTPTQEPNDAG